MTASEADALVNRITEETASWISLRTRAASVQDRLKAIERRRDDFVRRALEMPDALSDAISETKSTLEDARERLASFRERRDALRSKFESLEEALENTKEAIGDIAEEVGTTREEIPDRFREGVSGARDMIESTLASEVEAMSTHAEATSENARTIAEESVRNAKTSVGDLLSRMDTETASLTGHVGQRIEALSIALDDFHARWRSAVNETKSDFEKVGTEIDQSCRKVEKLAEAISSALRLTGGGMGTAARGVDEVVRTIESVY